jgi:hypothetical protein
LIVLGTLSFQVFRSYHFLHVTRENISSEDLIERVRVVLISDLHDHKFGAHNKRLVKKIKKQEPDLILMVGDLINGDSQDNSTAVELAEQLAEIAPVYYSLGNHEMAYIEANTSESLETFTNELATAGATVLDISYEDIQVGDQKLRIGGMYDFAFALDGNDSTNSETMDPDVYGFLTEFQDTDAYTLMMSHRPEGFVLGEASVTWDIDLVVSGHDHGGQVVIPFKGGLYGGDQGWFPTYVHGYHEKDLLNIFITSGLSSQKELLPRFNNPPEIAVLTLTPAE